MKFLTFLFSVFTLLGSLNAQVMLQQNAPAVRMFRMLSAADHRTPVTGVVPVVSISKNGSAFVQTGWGAEVGHGWYWAYFGSSETNTAGDLAVHVTCSGCAPTDFADRVIASLPANMVAIDGNPTAYPSAVLHLKQLSIYNTDTSNSHAISAVSAAGNGTGIITQGHGWGTGISAWGGSDGDGIIGHGNGVGTGIVAFGGNGGSGPGFYARGGTGPSYGGAGMQIEGAAQGNGLNIISGAGGTPLYVPKAPGAYASYIQGLVTTP